MKIDLYKLEPVGNHDLDGKIRRVLDMPLEERNRQRQKVYYRIETAQKIRHRWLIDFVQLRLDHGPGRAGLSSPMTNFEMEAGEGFGEDVGLLWDPRNDYCAVQYNHHSVRARAMAEYLSTVLPDQPHLMTLQPVLDRAFAARLRQKTIYKKLEVTVSVPLLDHNDYAQGNSVIGAARALLGSGVQTMHLTISAGRRELHRGMISNFVDWARGQEEADAGDGAANTRSALSSAKLTGKDDEDSASEVLDLLSQRVTTHESVRTGAGVRFTRDDRWNALERAFDRWHSYWRQ